MSGTFPTVETPLEIELTSNQPITHTISDSGRHRSRQTEGHLWGIFFKFDIMTRAEIAPIIAFCGKQRASSFQFIPPSHNAPLGTISGSPVSGSASRGGDSVSTSGWSGIFKAGSIFKFASHSKVYMVSEDVNAGGTLKFFPDLIENISGSAITFENTPLTIFIPDNVVKWKTSYPELSTYELTATESVNG